MWKLYSFIDLIIFQMRNGSGPQEKVFCFVLVWVFFFRYSLIPIMQCYKVYPEKNKMFEIQEYWFLLLRGYNSYY